MTGNTIIKIFLASSSELEDDREKFEIFINRENKKYIKKNIFLELVLWEDFIDAISSTRLQNEYNVAVENSHIFISLFHTKVGQYTEEEFEKAFASFKENSTPFIYTYFKDASVNLSQITPEINSLLNFKNKLHELGHFHSQYDDINDLKYQFGEQLNKLLPNLIATIGGDEHSVANISSSPRPDLQIKQQTTTKPTEKASNIDEEYIEILKSSCYALEIEGIQDLPGLALSDIFVPLRIESKQSRLIGHAAQEIWDFLPNSEQKPYQFPHRRIAILAPPGLGKTTLMRHLSLIYLTRSPEGFFSFLPVLLRLREVYSLMQNIQIPGKRIEGNDVRLPELIVRNLENQPEFSSQHWNSGWFDEKLKQGKCLVMFDGLDEVPQTQRQSVRRWVDRQMKAYRKTQFILTSRPHGFELNPDDTSHHIQVDLKLQVLNFNADEKQRFIEQWYKAVYWSTKWEPLLRRSQEKNEALKEQSAKAKSDREAQESADSLLRQIFNSPSLNDLARNPLLITMIANTHRANTELPNRRVELYEKISNLLLGSRPSVKQTPLTLTTTGNKVVLQVLAWNLAQLEITQFTPKQGTNWIEETLGRCCREHYFTTQDFWHEMVNIAGLLIEKEAGKYEFTHQTFQEYFAALHLKEKAAAQETLLEKLDNDRWEEIICFYAALGNASPLINAVLENPTLNRLKLANRLKNEGREVDREIFEHLNTILSETNLENSELAAELRLEQRFNNLKKIDHKTAISEPITWGEYGLFLEAQTLGQFHSTAEIIPISPERENKPVTGISQIDAQWFCGWLSTQASLQSEEIVYDYRLPNQSEESKITEADSSTFLWVVREEIPNLYRALLNYLANGRWRDADEETFSVMLEVAGKKNQGYLMSKDIDKFPCEDLQIINQQWLKFSGSRFGFSIQKEIYESLDSLGEYYNEEKRKNFYEQIGWVKEERMKKTYSEMTFNMNAPLAHLPMAIFINFSRYYDTLLKTSFLSRGDTGLLKGSRCSKPSL